MWVIAPLLSIKCTKMQHRYRFTAMLTLYQKYA